MIAGEVAGAAAITRSRSSAGVHLSSSDSLLPALIHPPSDSLRRSIPQSLIHSPKHRGVKFTPALTRWTTNSISVFLSFTSNSFFLSWACLISLPWCSFLCLAQFQYLLHSLLIPFLFFLGSLDSFTVMLPPLSFSISVFHSLLNSFFLSLSHLSCSISTFHSLLNPFFLLWASLIALSCCCCHCLVQFQSFIHSFSLCFFLPSLSFLISIYHSLLNPSFFLPPLSCSILILHSFLNPSFFLFASIF